MALIPRRIVNAFAIENDGEALKRRCAPTESGFTECASCCEANTTLQTMAIGNCNWLMLDLNAHVISVYLKTIEFLMNGIVLNSFRFDCFIGSSNVTFLFRKRGHPPSASTSLYEAVLHAVVHTFLTK